MFQLFQFVDGLLPVSGVVSISFWAAVSGVLSMLLYKRFSPQGRLEVLMKDLSTSQKELTDYDGEFDGMLPLLKQTLVLSLKRVWLSFGPSLVAAVPLILIMACIGYGLDQPPQNGGLAIAKSVVGENNNSDNDLQFAESEVADHQLADHSGDHTSVEPGWMQSWIIVFVCVSSCSALAVRQFGGII